MSSNPALTDLPNTLEYSGEFGVEVICFIPFVNWLQATGNFGHRRVLTYSGMRPFYFFLQDGQYTEKADPRNDVPFSVRPPYWPTRGTFRATEKKSAELFPNYREAFGGRFGHRFDKPLLVIHNKFHNEWGAGPMNFMTLETLDRLFQRLKDRFQIVYFREGLGSFRLDKLGFSADHNHPKEFDDAAVLERHPDVISFERMADAERGRLGYNELKLTVLADCHNFITSQGGGSYLTALFSEATTVILHRSGPELRIGTYARGFFRFLADAGSRLLVVRTSAELEDAAHIFLAGGTEADRLWQRYCSDHAVDPDHEWCTPLVW